VCPSWQWESGQNWTPRSIICNGPVTTGLLKTSLSLLGNNIENFLWLLVIVPNWFPGMQILTVEKCADLTRTRLARTSSEYSATHLFRASRQWNLPWWLRWPLSTRYFATRSWTNESLHMEVSLANYYFRSVFSPYLLVVDLFLFLLQWISMHSVCVARMMCPPSWWAGPRSLLRSARAVTHRWRWWFLVQILWQQRQTSFGGLVMARQRQTLYTSSTMTRTPSWAHVSRFDCM